MIFGSDREREEKKGDERGRDEVKRGKWKGSVADPKL